MADTLSKERCMRARVESVYNKQEPDFASRREYDDYLEEREDIILNLSEGIDVEATEAKLRTYERANFADIAANEARKVEDKRVHAEKQAAAKAAGSGAESAPAPTAAGPSAAAGAQYVAGPAQAAAAAAVAQPAPLQPPPRPADRTNGGGLDSEARARMAAASGWSPDFARRRMLAEAFSSVFVA
ncbi:hypothetical protein WJX81_006974 [Elliptochloris bilobata]|uniref:MAT1 centre domain-containing protein n=1 Tax=Elliptochloris bilobata TaxID=381761 RepID=A0AAW1QNJ3_9CHLO